MKMQCSCGKSFIKSHGEVRARNLKIDGYDNTVKCRKCLDKYPVKLPLGEASIKDVFTVGE